MNITKWTRPSSRVHKASLIGLPIVTILAVSYIGVALLHGSRAEELTIARAGLSSAQYPVLAVADCCRLKVETATITKSALQRVHIGLSIDNTSPAIVQLSPGLQTLLVDKSGAIYPYTATYLSPGLTVGGPIAIGGHSLVELDYDLPLNAVPRILSFQLDASQRPTILGLPL